MNQADVDRENRIDRHFLELTHGKTPTQRRDAFDKMKAEIAQRSADQVARMETAKGLR